MSDYAESWEHPEPQVEVIDVYDQAIERELIREANERHVLDLQSRTWRNLWWSVGLLAILYCCFGFPKWMKVIFQ